MLETQATQKFQWTKKVCFIWSKDQEKDNLARKHFLKIFIYWGAWVAQSVKRLTSARVLISRFVSSSPVSGSVLSAQGLLRILCLPNSLCPSLAHALSLLLSLKKKKVTPIFTKFFQNMEEERTFPYSFIEASIT